jgi:hypothetical protein
MATNKTRISRLERRPRGGAVIGYQGNTSDAGALRGLVSACGRLFAEEEFLRLYPNATLIVFVDEVDENQPDSENSFLTQQAP